MDSWDTQRQPNTSREDLVSEDWVKPRRVVTGAGRVSGIRSLNTRRVTEQLYGDDSVYVVK